MRRSPTRSPTPDYQNDGPDTEFEDELNLNFDFTVTDKDNDTATSTLKVTLDDDTPDPVCDTASVDEGGQSSTNLVLILDVSRSMGDDPDGPGGFATRLDLAKAAAINLIDTANTNQVFVAQFSTDAANSGWVSAADAITYINGLSLDASTNYDAALNEVMNNWGAGPTAATQTLAYFLSDGEPNEPSGSEGISTTEESDWYNFLSSHGVDQAFAIGVGAGLDSGGDEQLEPVAWTPGEAVGDFTDGADPNVIVISGANEADLVNTLVTVLPGTTSGNVLANDGFGADGLGGILSIVVDGHTYAYLPGSDEITKDGVDFAAGSALHLTTGIGGDLTFYFASTPGHTAGDWVYGSPASVDADTTEMFTYTIVDGDGDGQSACLKITVEDTGDNLPPSLSVEKLVDADNDQVFHDSEQVDEGVATIVTYQVTIQNTSNSQDPVTLTAIADDQIANDPALLAAAIAANGGSAVLAPGASLTFTYQSDAPLTLNADGSLVNTISVDGHDDENSPASASDTATVTAAAGAPSLSVEKLVDADNDQVFHDSEQVDEGVATIVTYQVTIQNTSNSQDPVTLTAIADDQIANDPALLAAAIAANGGSAVLAPGASLTFTYQSDAPLTLNADGSLVNTISVDGHDDENSPASASDTATVTAAAGAPSLSVEKLVDADNDQVFHDSEQVDEGVATIVTYQVTIQNTSNSQDPVTLTAIADDQIANDPALLAAAIAANGGSAVLAPGASLTFTYQSDAPLTLNADGSLVNTISVDGHDDENSPASASDTATVTAAAGAPSLSVEKLVDADNDQVFHDSEQVDEGVATIVTYQVTIQNTSNSQDPVTLTAIADDQIANDPALLAAAIAANGGSAVLAPGASLTFTYQSDAPLTLNADGSLVNTISVDGHDDENSPASASDTATVTAAAGAPSLSVEKLVDADNDQVFHDSEQVDEGVATIVTYQVTIQNTSNSQDPVTLTAIADDQIANDPALLAAAIAANGGSAVLAPGASLTFTYQSDAPLTLNADGSLVNTISVDGHDDENSPASASDTATVTAAAGAPSLSVEKLVDADNDQVFHDSEQVDEGVATIVTYQVTIQNTSNSQDPVTLTAIADDQIANDPALLAAAIAANGGSAVLAPGASLTFTYQSDAPLTLNADGSLVNTISVDGHDDENSPASASDAATVTAAAGAPSLSVEKLVDADNDQVFHDSEQVDEGVATIVTYQVTIQNTSNSQDPVTLTAIADDQIANDPALLAAAIAANGGSAVLAPGASLTFTYQSDAPLTLNADGSLVNTISVDGHDDENSPASASDTATVTAAAGAPSLSVEKLVDADNDQVFHDSEQVDEGVATIVTYQVTIQNTSNSQDPVTLTAIADDQIANDPALLAAAIAANGGSAVLAPGASLTFTYQSDAPLTLNADGSLVNTISVDGHDDENSPASASDTATVTAAAGAPSLSVEKLVDADNDQVFHDSEQVDEGVATIVTYQVTIQNTSNSQDPVTLTAIADDQIANDPALLAAAIAANGGSAVLAPGASLTFTYQSDAPLTLNADGSLVNTISVDGHDDENSPASASDTATVTAAAGAPSLSVEKLVDADNDQVFHDSEQVDEGVATIVTYQVTIQNTSNSQDPVTLTAIADDQIANDPALLAAAIAANGGSAVLAPGASLTFTYQSDAPLTLNADGSLVNTISVDGHDDENSPASASDTATVTAAAGAPSLSVEKLVDADNDQVFHDSEQVDEGVATIVTYQVTIQNTSNSQDPVTLTAIADDQIANDPALLAAAIAANGGSAVLAPGASLTFTYQSDAPLTLNADGSLVNTISVDGHDDENSPASASDTATVTAAAGAPSLSVEKLVDADNDQVFHDSEQVDEGVATIVTYQVTIQNTSNSQDPVTLTAIADDQIANDPALLAAAIAANGGSAVLAPGASLTFTYQSDAPLTLNADGSLVNTISVDGHDDENSPASASDTATVTAAAGAPSLSVEKLVDADNDQVFHDSEQVDEGVATIVTYQVTIQNTSNSQDPVTLTAIADDQIANDPALLAAAIAANGGSAVLAPGASLTFTYQSDAPLTLNADGSLVNTISVDGHDDENSPASASDTATVTAAAGAPSLSVEKLVDADNDQVFHDSEQVDEGVATIVTYQVTIQNTSNSQDPVTLTAIADDQIANDPALLAAAIAANGGSAVLAPGASLTFTYQSDAPLTLNADGSLVNTISVDGHDDENSPASASDTATVTAAAGAPSLSVEKLVDADNDQVFHDSEQVDEGVATIVTYQVTIQNTSNSQDPVTLTAIADDQIANDPALLAAAIAANGGSAVLAPGASLTFTYQSDAPLTLNADGSLVNTISVDGHDDENSPASASDTATVTADDVPQIGAWTIVADEDQLPAGNYDLPGPSLGDDAQSNLTGNLPIDFGADAVGATISFAALDGQAVEDTSANPVLVSATNAPLTYYWDAANKILYASTDATNLTTAASTAAFSLTITDQETGAYTFSLIQALEHPAGSGPTDNTEDPNLFLSLGYTATDGDGNSSPGTLDIVIDDDIPVLQVSGNTPALTVDETNFAVNATASFAGNFTPSYGADGPGSVSYALSVVAGASGLVDTATNQAVVLSLNGGVVEGRTSGSDDLVFTVSVDGAGNVTLEQLRAVVDPNSADPDNSVTLSAANLVQLTGTFTDSDDDSVSGTIDIGQALTFKDDGPSISVSAPADSLTVDETDLATNATASFADNFTSGYGADGAGTIAYALGVVAGASGLIDTATNQSVVLSLNGGVVEGRTSGSNDLVFTVSVDGLGNVTLDQLRAVVHPNAADPDNSVTLSAANLVSLTATITDKDGDSASAHIDIGQSLNFKDDTPTVSSNDAVQLDDDALAGGNPGGAGDVNPDTANTTGTLGHAYGADGAGTTLLLDTGTLPGGFTAALSNAGQTLTITQTSTGLDVLKIDLTDASSGAYTVTQLHAIDHPTPGTSEENLQFGVTYRVTDGDGDTVDGSISIDVDDDTPTAVDDTYAPTITGVTLLSGLLGNDAFGADGVDIDNSPVAGQVTATNGAHGTVVYNNDGTFTYTPDSGYNGSDSFTYTIKDHDGDTSTATVTLESVQTNTQPTAGTQSITVDEDGLPNGVAGGAGDVAGQAITQSGTLIFSFNADGPAASDPINFAMMDVGGLHNSAVVNTAAVAVTSGGAGLKYYWDGAGDTLYASTNTGSLANAQSTAAFKVVLNTATGAYTYTQIKPLDHPGHDDPGTGPVETSYEDDINIDLSYQVKDGNGDSATGTLSVTIDDDSPTATGNAYSVQEATNTKSDLLLVVDVSQSMTTQVDVNGNGIDAGDPTRIELAQSALLELINNPNVDEVKIVRFRGASISTVWMDKATALAFVNNDANFDSSVIGTGGTDYDAALFTGSQSADNGFDTLPATPSDHRLAFFMSDGEPTAGGGISAAEETNWISTLTSKGVEKVVAVGFGDLNATNATNLEPIAWQTGEVQTTWSTGAQDANVHVIADADLSELGAVLSGSIPSSISGNLLTDNTGSGADTFGADGGSIKSIVVGGITYTYSAATGDITASSGPNPSPDTPLLTVSTPLGGTLTFYFAAIAGHAAGDWGYNAPSVNSDQVETFAYTIVDGDGDASTANLQVTVTDVPEAPQLALSSSENVRDEFGTAAYNNNNGTANWGGNWTEVGDDTSATTGEMLVTGGRLNFNGNIDGGETITRAVDLTGASSATLSFDYEEGMDSGEDVVVEAWNGSTWDVLGTFPGSAPDGSNSFSAALTAAQIGSHTQIRFLTSGNWDTTGGGDNFFVDNVNIAYTKDMFTEGGSAVAIAAIDAAITDGDSANMASGSIVLTNEQSGDQFLINGVAVSNGSSGSFSGVNYTVTDNGSTITIAMTNSATKANYEAFIEGVSFKNTSENPATVDRTIQVTVNDGTSNSNTAVSTIHVAAVNDAPAVSGLTVSDTSIAFTITDPDNSSFSLASPFATPFGNPSLSTSANLSPSQQGSAVTGTLQVSDGAATANVVDLSLGTSGSNSFTAGANSAALYGFAGNDQLTGGSAADWIFGGAGDDNILGGQEDHLIDGGANSDTLSITANFTSSSDAQIVNIEVLNLSAGVTANLSNQSEGFAVFGTGGAETITTGSGDDTVTSGGGADNINTGSGHDVVVISAVVGTSSDSSRVTVAGNGNDTGQDTITGFDLTNDTLRISGTNVSSFVHSTDTAIGTAGAVNDGTVGSFTALTGLVELNQTTNNDWDDAGDIAVTFASPTGTFNEANFEARLQYDLTGTSSANTITTGALADIINGGGGNDTLNGGGGDDTITGGTGADTMTGGSGADTFIVGTTNSTVTIGGTGNSGTITGFDVITDFNSSVDKLDLGVTAISASNTSGANGTNSSLTIGGNQVSSHAISNGIITFDDASTFASALSLSSTASVAAVVQYLQANDLGNAGTTVAFTATISGTAHTYIYQQPTTSAGSGTVIDLQGVTLANINTLIGGAVDPIVIDLGQPGISFSHIQAGVSFDINGDGAADQIAWTNGEDGVLAMDLDHSGAIENGSEILSEYFGDGSHADGIAALASLDDNGDGVIDANDAAFASLLVWQDANHDGVSDPGELTTLADHGISSISLGTTAGSEEIDGQAIAAHGLVTHADGSISDLVEVNFDATLGNAPANDGPLVGIDGEADIFRFDDAGSHSDIANYNGSEDDTVDLSALLDAAFGPGSDAADFVQVVADGDNIDILVDVDGSGAGLPAHIATLLGVNTADADPVKVYFGGESHTFTV